MLTGTENWQHVAQNIALICGTVLFVGALAFIALNGKYGE